VGKGERGRSHYEPSDREKRERGEIDQKKKIQSKNKNENDDQRELEVIRIKSDTLTGADCMV